MALLNESLTIFPQVGYINLSLARPWKTLSHSKAKGEKGQWNELVGESSF